MFHLWRRNLKAFRARLFWCYLFSKSNHSEKMAHFVYRNNSIFSIKTIIGWRSHSSIVLRKGPWKIICPMLVEVEDEYLKKPSHQFASSSALRVLHASLLDGPAGQELDHWSRPCLPILLVFAILSPVTRRAHYLCELDAFICTKSIRRKTLSTPWWYIPNENKVY